MKSANIWPETTCLQEQLGHSSSAPPVGRFTTSGGEVPIKLRRHRPHRAWTHSTVSKSGPDLGGAVAIDLEQVKLIGVWHDGLLV